MHDGGGPPGSRARSCAAVGRPTVERSGRKGRCRQRARTHAAAPPVTTRPRIGLRALALLAICGHLLAACATRAPVVTTPQFPGFIFPAVPADLAGSEAAREHERAWQFLQAGDLDAATAGFRAVLASSPGFHPSEAGLGYVGLAQGDADTAVGGFDRALARSPAYVPALLGRGEALLRRDDLDGALASFEAALAADPGVPELRERVAELRFTSLMAQVGEARAAAAAGRNAAAVAAYERVIAASPDSAFLYVELAQVERRRGDMGAALERLDQAVALDPDGAAAWDLMADLYLAREDFDRAEQALLRLDAIEPGPEVARRLADVAERRRVAALPPEFRAIEASDAVTRGELAALVEDRFPDLLRGAGGGQVTIITDARTHWAYDAVVAVARAQVMDVDTNYRFLPEQPVTRAELADVTVRLLEIGAGDVLADAPGRTSFSDLAPGHLSYPAAAAAVASGILAPLDRNSFQPGRQVSGAEAVAALRRLATLMED